MRIKTFGISVAAVLLTTWGSVSFAAPIVSNICPEDMTGFTRQVTLSPADTCAFVEGETGTPKAADVAALYPPGPYEEAGSVTGPGGDKYFTVGLTTGSWGDGFIEGTFEIDPSFWYEYGVAIITFHFGGGSGSPDWFFFEVTPGTLSGTWTYNGDRGGLSNLFLWGGGDPFCTPDDPDCLEVPEPGTLGLLGLGLAGLGFGFRRRRKI